MKKHILHILRDIGIFFVTIAALWAFLLLSLSVPNSAIRSNMEKSVTLLSATKEEHALEYEGKKWNTYIDYYADTILAQVAWNMGEGENPLKSSLDTKYFEDPDGYTAIMKMNLPPEVMESVGLTPEHMNTHEAYAFSSVLSGNAEPNTDYSRYWHGTAGFIRFFHLFTDIDGVKTIGFVAIMTLAACLFALLALKREYLLAAIFAASLVSVKIWTLLYCIEYQPSFAVGLLMCILFLMFERKGNTPLFILSVISGAAIAFFDFLTTETLTVILPLILVVYVRARGNRLGSFFENVKMLLGCGLRWAFAYGGAFIAKWSLTSLFTGENKFALALSSAEVRVSGEIIELAGIDTLFERLYASILANFSMLFNATNSRMDVPLALVGILVCTLAVCAVCLIFKKKNTHGTAIKLLLILGGVVIVRFLALNNHSIRHMFFTYRALVSVIVAVGAVTVLACSKSKRSVPLSAAKGKKQREKLDLTILMPCYNEEESIKFCIEEALQCMKENRINGEVLIADNASTDSSARIAKACGARVTTVYDKGYGNALIGGIKAAKGRYIIMGDCDGSYIFADSVKILEKLEEGYSLVVGNRFAGGIEKGAMPFSHKYIGVPLLSALARHRYDANVGDFHCGLRGFDREKALSLELGCGGMEFATEIIAKFADAGEPICEIPTKLRRDRRSGSSHLRSIPDGMRHLRFIFFGK